MLLLLLITAEHIDGILREVALNVSIESVSGLQSDDTFTFKKVHYTTCMHHPRCSLSAVTVIFFPKPRPPSQGQAA